MMRSSTLVQLSSGIVHQNVRDRMFEVFRCGIGVHEVGLHQLDAIGEPDDGRLQPWFCGPLSDGLLAF